MRSSPDVRSSRAPAARVLGAACVGVAIVAGAHARAQSNSAAPAAATSVTNTSVSAPAAAVDPAPPASKPPPFRLFRHEDEYWYYADPATRQGFFDRVKYIPLNQRGDVTLSLGGEVRERYEYLSAPAFGLRGSGHDDFLLQRVMAYGDLHAGDRNALHGRAFLQLNSGFVTGEEFPKPGNQDNLLDIQQVFGEVLWGDNRPAAVNAGTTAIGLRVGRQEMGFGSFRLVTVREPTNSRLAFDGIRATLHADAMTFDAFLVRPVDQKIGLMNDGQDDNTTFWGVYSSIPLQPQKRLGIDAYYLGLNRESTRFQSGVGDELRHSIGTRIWGRANGWDHDTELVLQFGTFDLASRSEDILAWTVASNTGYTFESVAWKPRIGLKVNVASGDDDPNDDQLGTFNPLFPRNNYFSDATLVAPYNFFDIQPTLTLRPTETLTLNAGFDAFFRYSTDDAVFSPTGIVIGGPASNDRYVGSTISLSADWAITRNITLSASYAHFFKGDVVKDAGGKDVDYFGIWMSAKF